MTTLPRRFVLAASFALLLSGCATKSINQLLADPTRYANREVTLHGEVVKSVSVLGRGAYRLDDGTGSLWIVSEHGVPRRGARVKVTGKVRDAFDLGSIIPLPEPVANGLVLIEHHHKGRY
jgi:hypothetical protein